MITKRDFERIGGWFKDAAAVVVGNRWSDCLDVPYRMQVDGCCCGLCSALMVAEFYSVRIPEGRIEQFAENSLDGTDTGPLTRFLRASGLSVRVHGEGDARIATIIDALDQDIPVIVSVRPPHYLVVIGYDSTFFYVNDPSPKGNVSGRIARTRFRRIWTREALVVTKRSRLRRARKRPRR